MKILYYTALFVILVGCVTATISDTADTEFREAVDQGELSRVVGIWWKSEGSHDNAKYLVENASTGFIVGFAEQTLFYRSRIITALYASGSEATCKGVLERVSFENYELALAANNPEIPCQPKKFLELLEKMADPEYKDVAIRFGIKSLFKGKRTECIDPLLNALKKEKNLKYNVIRAIFREGAHYDEVWAKRFFDHPAITSIDYAGVLTGLVSGKCKRFPPIFVWLFNEADQGDLKALQAHWSYMQLSPNVRFSLDLATPEALYKAKPAGSRRNTWEKVKLARDVVYEATSGNSAKEIFDLVGEYFTGEAAEKEK